MIQRETLITAWIKEGLLEINVHDGESIWTDRVSRVDRTLLGELRDSTRDAFIRACEISGYKPNQILDKYSLSQDAIDYGMPLPE